MYRQIITLKKDSFAVSSSWSETYKLLAHSLERTVCLFWQQGIIAEYETRAEKIFIWQSVSDIRERILNKGGEEL